MNKRHFSIILASCFFFAASAVAFAGSISLSTNQLVVGKKVTLTSSFQITPLSSNEDCYAGGGTQIPNCAFTTQVWLWRSGYRYKQAQIVSNDDHTITFVVPDVPNGNTYRVGVEHDYTGRGFARFYLDTGLDVITVTHPILPSPSPSPSPSINVFPSPVASSSTSTIEPSSTPEMTSPEPTMSPDPSPSPKAGDQTTGPQNFWQRIIFSIQGWWKKVWG